MDGPAAAAAAAQFESLKRRKLGASWVDLSNKGSVDAAVVGLVSHINSLPQYFTLSSCSGRVTLSSKHSAAQKQHLQSHFSAHAPPSEEELRHNLKGSNSVLKFEPFVLHVQCRDLHAAKKMLTHAIDSGHRNSGIVPAKSGLFVLAVRSTLTLEVPLTDESGNILVSDLFLQHVTGVIRQKFQQNDRYLARFEKNVVEDNLCEVVTECEKTG